MTEGAKPSITGIHHFSPTVTDVETSVAWYQRLFGMDRVPVPFPHYEREDTGYAVVLTMSEPFYVAAGFGMYLNRRMELEAWDIEKELRRAFPAP